MIASTIDERCHGAILPSLSPVLCYVLDQIAAQPKPYVSIRELSSLTPWTEQAIRTMMAKGILRESEHFFHVGRRPIFKWGRLSVSLSVTTQSTRPEYRFNGEAS